MIREGTTVKWKWGKGTAQGKVEKTYVETVKKHIDGSEIVRHGETGNKALFIEQDNGAKVLKLESEVTPVRN